MKKRREIQILSIVALVIAVAGMSIGFAVFSTTLNISSSATVSPNADEFNIDILCIGEEITNLNSFDDFVNPDLYTSRDFVYPVIFKGDVYSSSIGRITKNGGNISISDITVQFANDSDGVANYVCMIKNESSYDVTFTAEMVGEPSCTSSEEMTPLMAEACNGFVIEGLFRYANGDKIFVSGEPLIKPGEYDYLGVVYSYDLNNYFPDGNLELKFPDFKFVFSPAV